MLTNLSIMDTLNHVWIDVRQTVRAPEPGQIALQVQTPDTGTVAGGGTFSRGTVVTLVATAADNHHFVHWTENGRIVSQDAEYSSIVADGRDLVAHFAIDRYEVVLSADPAGSGTTTGAGTYDHGSQITVAAQPADGYRFIQWTEAGATVSTEAQYQFTVQGPRTLQAQFDHAIVFAGGSGTESDPYQVASPLHLYNLRRYPGACFEQTADIDLNTAPWNEAEGWSPIGWVADGFDFDAQETFSGVFDGKGFVIRNLTLNRPAVAIQGLFGLMTGGEIRNVVMENADVHGDSDVGALVGVVQGGKVVHCRVSGSVTSQWHGVGGLVGRLEADGEISHCVSSVAVTGNSGMAGGLVGQTLGTIRGSRASGPVIGGWYAGGFAGGTPAGLIEDCYATGSVTDPEGLGPVGGFAGGERWGDMAELVIRNCYATGEVGDAEEAGGLVSIWGPPEGGEGFQGRVENSYWDMDTTTEAQSAAGEGRTTAQMTWPHGADTYQGWDFTTVWRADEDGTRNNGYPCLRMPGDADFFLTYLAGPNGFLEGATQQGVMAGESGSPVRAVAAAGYRFVGWSDGLGANPRTDVDVTATITVTADFKMIGDLNLNGRIDTGDALWAIGQAAGLADLDAVQKKLGNITGQADDDLPRLADAVQILGILTRPLGTNASD